MFEEKFEYQEEIDGMNLLGWRFGVRLTNEEICRTSPLCKIAIAENRENKLSFRRTDELASAIFEVIRPKYINEDILADDISLTFSNSRFLSPLIKSIDESALCFLRGYYTAAVSLMFITLERYLRSTIGWKPNDKDPTFFELKNSILNLNNIEYAKEAHKILDVIYSKYRPQNPTTFEFNRHGLLHGVRASSKYDEMNYVRLFQLFGLLCDAEGVRRVGYGDVLVEYNKRVSIYADCYIIGDESTLLE